MKIVSIKKRKNVKVPENSLTIDVRLKSNDARMQKNNDSKINVVKLNFDCVKAYKDKEKKFLDKQINHSSDKKTMENDKTFVPQKILKFDEKLIKNKKSNNIKLYQTALIDNLKLIIINGNKQNKKNNTKQKFTNEMIRIKLPENKSNSLFNNYKKYQNEFLSSAYNLNNPILIDSKINNSTITPRIYQFEKISKIDKIKKKKLSNNNSCNNFFTRPISNILQRRNHGEIPLYNNFPITFIKSYKSSSEKERDEKNSQALLKLRDFLDNYWDKRIELVTEFFYIYKIFENKYYKSQNLENFANFVYDNINENTKVFKGIIETRIPMKEIIDKGIKYNNFFPKKLRISRSASAIIKNTNSTNNHKYNKYLRINQTNYTIRKNNRFKHFNLGQSKSNETLLNSTNRSNRNYFNIDNYELYDKEKRKNEKIIKYRKFLDKNYGMKVNYKFMSKYNQKEKENYFNKRKIGTIFIPDKENLFNNIKKQTKYYKTKKSSFSNNINSSIFTFSEKDCNELYKELKETKENYINYGNENNENKKSEENNIWIKMYEDLKRNKFQKQPDIVLKKKKKLLEYIIFESIQKRKEFEKDLLK
jgi:hypothetical protein